MPEDYSRYEVNRNVRMVLTRHDVDLSRIDYSFMGTTVYLYGELVKGQGDFSGPGIEALAKELAALPHVRDIQFDLSNWIISSSSDAWHVAPAKKGTAARGKQGGTSGDGTHVIERAETFAEVLKEVEKKQEETKGEYEVEIVSGA